MLSIIGKPSHLNRASVKLNSRNELSVAVNWFEPAVLSVGMQRFMEQWLAQLAVGISVSHCYQPGTNNLESVK